MAESFFSLMTKFKKSTGFGPNQYKSWKNINKKLKIFGLMLLQFSFIEADLSDFFKKPQNKSCVCPIDKVDYIYVINLDHRPEKLEHTLEELAPYGIVPYRFSAVNGWELSLEDLNELGVMYEPWMVPGIWGTCYFIGDEGAPRHEIIHVPNRNYFSHGMSRGAIGINLSHLSVLQDALESGYDTIWVMEDDIEVKKDPLYLNVLIGKLDLLAGKDGWDILFTDPDTKGKDCKYVICAATVPKPNFTPVNPLKYLERWYVSDEFRWTGSRYGAYSMIIRRSGMEKILNYFKKYKIFFPFDIEYALVPDLRMYSLNKDLVSTQCDALSDNGVMYHKK